MNQGSVTADSALRSELSLGINNFRKGATAPTDSSLGTTPTVPTLLFAATNELLTMGVIMPEDWDRSVDIELVLLWALASIEVDGDQLDITVDYVVPVANSTGDGPAKASSSLTGAIVATTIRGLAVGDVYEMAIPVDRSDATNPYDASGVGFAFEFHLTNTTEVASAHFLGAVLRYQRSPVSIGSPEIPNLTRLEWTVENLGTYYVPGDPVDSWVDVSQGIDVTAALTLRPTYEIDGGLGACVRIDGSNDDLESADGQGLDWSGGVTFFAVMQRTGALPDALAGPFSARETGMSRSLQALEVYGGVPANGAIGATNRSPGPIGFWNAADAAIDSNDPTLWSIRWDSTLGPGDGPWRVDGAAITVSETSPQSAPTDTIDIINIGTGFNGTSLDGDIYAVVVYYGRLMTPAEVLQVETSLNARFGVF